MFSETPTLISCLDAIDELGDTQNALQGLSTFALSLAVSDLPDKDSLVFLANVLSYCALSIDAACSRLELVYD